MRKIELYERNEPFSTSFCSFVFFVLFHFLPLYFIFLRRFCFDKMFNGRFICWKNSCTLESTNAVFWLIWSNASMTYHKNNWIDSKIGYFDLFTPLPYFCRVIMHRFGHFSVVAENLVCHNWILLIKKPRLKAKLLVYSIAIYCKRHNSRTALIHIEKKETIAVTLWFVLICIPIWIPI